MSHLRLPCCGRSPVLSSGPEKDQGPDILCHWFSPARCLSPSSWLSLRSRLLSLWPALGPPGCGSCMAATEGEPVNKRGTPVPEPAAFVKLELHCLGLGKDQVLFQTNQSIFQSFLGLCWALPITKGSFPQIRHHPLTVNILTPTVHAA